MCQGEVEKAWPEGFLQMISGVVTSRLSEYTDGLQYVPIFNVFSSVLLICLGMCGPLVTVCSISSIPSEYVHEEVRIPPNISTHRQ